jgi:glycosyltransferase involved in cell wall biosynthesis
VPAILFLNHAAVLGGGELTLPDLARAFPRSRVVLLQTGPLERVLEEAGVAVEVLPADPALVGMSRQTSRWESLRALPALLTTAVRLAWRARRYDLVYANSQKALLVGALAAMLARRPLVWHLHDILTLDHFSRSHIRAMVALANWRVRQVLATSRAAAEAFQSAGGRRVSVLYLGIDPVPFETARPARLGCPDDVPLAGLFSRMAPWKGQHVLLDALALVPDWRVLLVGDALFGEQAYVESLHDQVERLQLRDRVYFLGFRHDVAECMAACDIIVHTSVKAEPFGRVLVEGMLAGRPVVATDAGGPREIVEAGVTGLLVPPGDAGALARALEALRDGSLRERLGRAGHVRARRYFSPEALRERLRAQIGTILEQDQGGGDQNRGR